MEGLLDPTPCVRQRQSQRKQAMYPKRPEAGGARQTEAEPEETQHRACSRNSVPRTPASKAAADIIGHALKPDLKARSPVFRTCSAAACMRARRSRRARQLLALNGTWVWPWHTYDPSYAHRFEMPPLGTCLPDLVQTIRCLLVHILERICQSRQSGPPHT